MHTTALACAYLVVLWLLPSFASAAGSTCQAPPGTSGIDQYCETIPGATGDHGAGGHSGGGRLSPTTRRALLRAGTSGRVVLGASSAGAAGERNPAARHDRKRSGHDAAASPAPGNNPLSAVRNAVQGGDSTGSAFVWA